MVDQVGDLVFPHRRAQPGAGGKDDGLSPTTVDVIETRSVVRINEWHLDISFEENLFRRAERTRSRVRRALQSARLRAEVQSRLR